MVERLADHPDPEELRAFGQGRLAPEATLALEEHLAGCPSCCELLDEAPGDSFVIRLRAAGTSTTGERGRGGPTGGDGVRFNATQIIPAELVDHPRYRVLGLVGQGGMGAVYRAEHRRMERLVALKVINPGLMENPAAVQRFQQEARAAARLHHANIVTAYDADQAGELHFLVMECVEGISLAELVHRRGPLPVAEACAYARQAALGLQHAHEQGMVHRDIKPQNLMVVSGGVVSGEWSQRSLTTHHSPLTTHHSPLTTHHLKILDFGLARLPRTPDAPPASGASFPACRSAGKPAPRLTGAGTVMGTADYVAPEQAADPRTADIRADIYALGCTLFHLLTGRPPFPDGTVAEKLAQHAETPLPSVNSLRPEVPPGLEAVLARMTAKNPAERYATPGEVADALAPFTVPSLLENEQTAVRRRKRRRWLVAVLLLVAAGMLAGAAVLRFRNDRDELVGPDDNGNRAPIVNTDGLPKADELDEQSASNLKAYVTIVLQPRPFPAAACSSYFMTVPEAKAAQLIQRLGGEVKRDNTDPNRPVVQVNLIDKKVTDDDLWAVAACKRLETLSLNRTAVGDAGLQHLTGLTQLKSLTLTSTKVTNAGMKFVGGLKQLHSLDLQSTAVGDDGMKPLSGLTGLSVLSLYSTRVTDAGMADVGRLKSLTFLSLDNTGITDAGIKDLTGLANLATLGLFSVKGVGDEGMKSVARLDKLVSVDLRGTRVTDEGLRELAGCKKLSQLQIGGLKVTDAGVQALSKLRGLHVLDLSNTAVTDEGLKEVAKLRNLSNLNLSGAGKVTDTGVKRLAALGRLNHLNLAGTGVTAVGLRDLAVLPNLNHLVLGGPGVTDAELKELPALQNLSFLSLMEPDVTDAGLAHLAGCSQLTFLQLYRADKVTNDGVAKLRQALPNLRIVGRKPRKVP